MFQRIRALLKEKNIFAKDMLLDLGINKDQLKRWETGKSEIKAIHVNAIANYLGVSPEYLRGETDEKKQPALNGLSEDKIKLIQKIETMSESELRRFETILSLVEKEDI